MHSLRSNLDSRSTVRRLRRKRRDVVRRKRRIRMLTGSAALAFALSTALAVASFTGTDLAGAAVSRAASLADLMDGRSPGARTEAQLTKTKSRRVLAERVPAPPVVVPHNLAEVIAPPIKDIVPVDLPKPPAMLFAAPALPPGAIFFSPPGGGGGLPGGGGGGPGGGGGSPPGSPPSSPPLVGPPAVPEPGTWMTMLMGFAFVGWSLRRQRKTALARVPA